nr:hypothetical protein HK105_000963 [Polyrhizophydium stewartii]
MLRELVKTKLLSNIHNFPGSSSEAPASSATSTPEAAQAAQVSNGPVAADPRSKEAIQDYEERIVEALDLLPSPPFTIQRICELAVRPTQNHRSLWKYLHALEKVVMVTTSTSEISVDTPAAARSGSFDAMETD